jgi:hypothetical protein
MGPEILRSAGCLAWILELLEELVRRLDRVLPAKGEQVLIVGDEHRVLACGEREEIVVIGIGRAARRSGPGIGSDHCLVLEECHQPMGFLSRDPRADLWIVKRALEL